MSSNKNDYTPGVGSYKTEEGGSLKGIGLSNNVDYQFGTLSFDREDFSISSRGIPLSLSSRFNSDHLYSTVIKQIAKGVQPAGSLMTLPEGPTNFYRIADGWSWDLPYIVIGKNNVFKIIIAGKTFDLSSVISESIWNEPVGDGADKTNLWVEGYHVRYSALSGSDRALELAIPEAGVIITCTVSKVNTTPEFKVYYDDSKPFKMYSQNGTVMEFKKPGETGTGHIRKITDAAEKNSIEFFYETDGDSITGTIQTGIPHNRSNFKISTGAGAKVKAGDLITVRDESRVIWGIAGDRITISGGFNFVPVAGTDAYNISKGKIQKIVHSDGRCVKFYYYNDAAEEKPRMTTLLSSDPDMDHLAEGDLFLNRYTFLNKRLVHYESLDTKDFIPTDSFDITNDLAYIDPIQSVTYGYDISADPGPETDYMTIKNHAGAITRYLFQKGGFCSHSYNTLDIYQGTIRPRSSASILNIDEPDFFITTDYYFGISRYKVFNDKDSEKDKSAIYKTEKKGWLIKKEIVDYKACSGFEKVSAVLNGNRVKLVDSLPIAPFGGDQYLAFRNFSAIKNIAKATSPINSNKIFINTTGVAAGNYIAIRNEIRKITAVNSDSVMVESPFSFLPSFEGGADTCAIVKRTGDCDFFVYYLNKPKVVKIEIKENETAAEWKSTSYKYTYLKGGNETTDDIGGGGFIDGDIDGEADEKIIPDDIKLVRTSVITWKDGKEQTDYTMKVIEFEYDNDNILMGQKTVKNYRKQDSEWIPVDMTVNVIGHPATNAAYYGITSNYYYNSTCTYTETSGIPDDQKWKKYVDLDFDAYGRVIRSRTYSPSLAGGQSLITWNQYVGIGTGDDLDPYGEFINNPYVIDYQTRYNTKHCFNLLGGQVVLVNKDGVKNRVFHNYDPLLNITITRNVVESGLLEGDFFHTLDFKATYNENGTPVTESDITKIYHKTKSETERSNNWSTVRFSLPGSFGVRNLITLYSYNAVTNNLEKIMKPLGNEINLVYGAGWKGSYIVCDYTELDENLGATSQYIVNSYDYDIKGRITSKKTNLLTDVEGTIDYDSAKYPQNKTEYEYDGMDRVTLKKAGSATTVAVLKQVFDDDNLKTTVTDFLGFRTVSLYDRFYRPVKVENYRPDRKTNIDYDTPVANPVRTGSSEMNYDIMSGKVFESIKFSDNEESENHRIISRIDYDKLGRPIKNYFKNMDTNYDGSRVYQLLSETEYLDAENAVVSKSYLGDADNSFRKTKIVNDWLGRGVVEEHTWSGKNGSGDERVVRYGYNNAGKIVQKQMPNGEKYGYIYNSLGQHEKSSYPDGKYSIVNYNNNSNILRTKDRRGVTLNYSYNKSDMLSRTEAEDLLITRKYCHYGPAITTETEDSSETIRNEYEYHFSGGVTKNTQVMGSSISQILEASWDDGGNQVTVTATGSGSGGNEWSKTLNIDNQYHSSTPDGDHFNKSAILDGTSEKIIRESNYLGLGKTVKYGTAAAREVTSGYNNFLYLKSLASSEATPELDINMTRDFTGNILAREGNTYTYDGMNRLLSGEGEDYRYDEISNILSRGDKVYEYQSVGASKNQMRLKTFSNGEESYNYTYDENGNTVAVSGRFSEIIYDKLNRLREITHSDSKIDRYSYNSAGLRFRKEEDVNGSNVVLYSMYSGNNPVIEEKHEGSTLVETRFNIISGGAVLAHIRKVYGVSEEYEYFYTDNLGSRRVVLDASGSVLDKFSYSAYGEVTHVTGSNSSLASFTGKGYDATGLIYFNARYYDPITGRFVTEDPSRDGVNWYGYCGNNPVNLIDPDGRYSNDPDNDDGGGGGGIDGSGRGYSGRTIEEAREDDRRERERKNRIPTLEIRRGIGSDDQNDTARLIVNGEVIAEFAGIQSEKNKVSGTELSYENDYSDPKNPNATLPEGDDYTLTIGPSKKYGEVLRITSQTAQLPGFSVKGIKDDWGFLVHDMDTYSTARSLGCQIFRNDDFSRLMGELKNLGLKTGDTLRMTIE